MADTLKPDTPEAVLDIIKWAAAESAPLEVIGKGSKRGIGRPVQARHTLDMSDLNGITLYEPDELVLSALAGTALSEIEDMLAANDQELAFEPMNYQAIDPSGDGSPDEKEPTKATIGGVLATNQSGPRRIKAGAARDHILGVSAISGRGEAFKSGGRVVKNVTGYDLSKGLAGSWGTLAVATHVTFKVLPRAETEATLLVHGPLAQRAIETLCLAMGSSCEISGAAHLPSGANGRVDEKPVTAYRIEGFEKSVAYRLEKLAGLIGQDGENEIIRAERSQDLWRSVRDADLFSGSRAALWRLSVTPSEAPKIVESIQHAGDVRALYDWSGGLVWIEVDDGGENQDAMAEKIRSTIKANGGGHATLVRGSPALRTAIEPFEPQETALAALSQRLKENFDPHGILNPGRLSTQY